mgnify:CR=1 FL=1
MTKRHPDLFKVLIGEIGQDGKADVVLGKALGVLPETELLKPVSHLLHRGSAPDYRAYAPASAMYRSEPGFHGTDTLVYHSDAGIDATVTITVE